MAILKIARMGAETLSQPSDPVEDPTHPDIAALVDDMIDTLEDAGGAGLAAPQVYVPKRVVIFHVPKNRAGDGHAAVPLTILINPVITPLDGQLESDWEGCLSLPGLMGRVPRWARIHYAGIDGAGRPVEREASGFHARVVQHECDHLDGMLYPMRMPNLEEFGFVEDIRRRLALRNAT